MNRARHIPRQRRRCGGATGLALFTPGGEAEQDQDETDAQRDRRQPAGRLGRAIRQQAGDDLSGRLRTGGSRPPCSRSGGGIGGRRHVSGAMSAGSSGWTGRRGPANDGVASALGSGSRGRGERPELSAAGLFSLGIVAISSRRGPPRSCRAGTSFPSASPGNSADEAAAKDVAAAPRGSTNAEHDQGKAGDEGYAGQHAGLLGRRTGQ